MVDEKKEKQTSEEKVFRINLRRAFEKPMRERGKYAVMILKNQLSKYLKSQNIKLDTSVNKFIFKRGIEKTPRKIEIVVKKEKDIYRVYLFSEYNKASKKEEVKVETSDKEKKQEEKINEEKKQ
ncbi:MAG: hypothetical protein QXF76_03315 [Candidatus Anstonellales archaeon]